VQGLDALLATAWNILLRIFVLFVLLNLTITLYDA
jgi:hypothetical protein